MDTIRLQPSLARDFRVMTIGIIAVAFIIIIWVIGSSYNKQARASLQQMDADALRVERYMLLTLENTNYVLESLGRQIIRSEGAGQREAISNLLEAFLPSSGSMQHVLSWVNRNQELIVSNNGGVLKRGVDVSDRDYAKKAIAEPWRLHIGRPIQGRVSGKWVLPISMGITDDAGHFLGIVLISMDVKALTHQLEGALQTGGLHLAVTNRAYTLILETPSSPFNFEEQTPIADMLAVDFTSQRRHLLSQPSITHPSVLLRVVDAPETLPLRMFYTMHKQAFSGALMVRIIPHVLEVLGITLFLLFILWSLRRRILTPVATLTHHTSNVARATQSGIPEIIAPIEVQQLRQEIQHLCNYVAERSHVCDELRSKLNQLTERTTQTTTQQDNFHAMATGLLHDIRSLAQQTSDREARPTLLALLREARPIFATKNGKTILHEASCDMGLLTKRIMHAFEEKSPIDAKVTLDKNASMVWLRCDEQWVQHTLTLLLDCEAEQIANSPELHITASIRNGAWWLTVTREGNENESISSLTGLAIARAIMALHGGSVEHQSAATGKRSITLRFPANRVSN